MSSGTLEVIRGDHLVVDISNCLIPTLSVDESSHITVKVDNEWGRAKGKGVLYTTNHCNNVAVVVLAKENNDDSTATATATTDTTDERELARHPVEYVSQSDQPDQLDEPSSSNEIVQWISRYVDNQFLTEVMVREGQGYATTKREKEIADLRDKVFDMKCISVLLSHLLFIYTNISLIITTHTTYIAGTWT